ncbi:hypothetical protein NI35_0275 [Salmonella enterica subsp. enterica serovar Cerro]|nr:hypothetical protein SPAB_02356 [Salmonella enterica subsp. enterica serovar Paratyphi B str. SPB7]APT77921.1 hypothetical protein GW13_PRO1045 [Salmonella enterica subsp. enterica serovar Cerro]EDY29173.1 hypothetical protein SeSB_A1442 [Salmonella enterica subsp. enterica serovar Schwarzengrund str. SL480]ENZ87393.1 hypothetical protein D088_640044 [Salmonella enterica subsp. houtenae serovar 16:z4,z32:-- str. RKS3027]KMN27722.1 hypothetical protein NI35_0275 [Salmonella enterica subsp. en
MGIFLLTYNCVKILSRLPMRYSTMMVAGRYNVTLDEDK